MDPVLGTIVVVGIIAAVAVFYMHKKHLSATAVEQQVAAKVAALLGKHANPPAAASPPPQAALTPAAPAPSNAVPVALVRQPDGTVAPSDGPPPVGTPVQTLPPGVVVVLPDPNPPAPPIKPVAAPLPKPVVPGAGDLPDEFFERPAGVWWWRSPGNGQEYGPVDAAYDGAGIDGARHYRERIAASRWAQDPANPTSQQATSDIPGLGYPLMTPEQIATTLASFDASIGAGREDLAYYQLSSQEMFALQNRGMKRVDVNAKINQYNP